MSWSTLTVTDVLTALTGPEKSALQTAALQSGQSDPLDGTVGQVVQEIRGYVAACRQNKLGDGATIPLELKADAIAIIRYRALNRLPTRSLMTSSREQEYKEAIRKLEQVAACRFAIEQPAEVTDQVISGPAAEVVTSTPRRFTRDKLSGL